MRYYNDNDPKSIKWLEALKQVGAIGPGTIDGRSIKDVKSNNLAGFTRCHFFAGIGGWEYALQLAGWPADRPVWTGSCPCQPFSRAGKGKGEKDPRHLWPDFHRLIAECHPQYVFGEQVESAIGKGWLDGISADLEREGYAVGRVFWAHTASALPTSDSDCTGLPTPRAADGMRHPLRTREGVMRTMAKGNRSRPSRLEDALALLYGPGGNVNPAWSLWLMGYPEAWWNSIAVLEMP